MQHDRGTWTAARHCDHVLWLCEASLRVTADDRLVEEIEFQRLASWQVPCRLDDPRSSRHAAFCAVRCTLRARPLAAKTRQVNRERSSLVLKILPAEGHGAHYNAIVIDRHGIGIVVTLTRSFWCDAVRSNTACPRVVRSLQHLRTAQCASIVRVVCAPPAMPVERIGNECDGCGC